MTGEDCYVLKVAIADTADLESLVDRLITGGDPVSSIVMSSLTAGRPIATVTQLAAAQSE